MWKGHRPARPASAPRQGHSSCWAPQVAATGCLSTPANAGLLPLCPCSAEAAALSRHPKFKALKEQLLTFRGRGAFHGIVFARSREAVRALARLIGAAPDLQFLEASAACCRRSLC